MRHMSPARRRRLTEQPTVGSRRPGVVHNVTTLHWRATRFIGMPQAAVHRFIRSCGRNR